MFLREGEVIAGQYVIEEALGSGGAGRVYRAWDNRRNKRVAVKLVQLVGTEPAFRARIEREMRVLQHLEHPHVVRCLDAGPVGEQRLYLVLEWLEGFDLSIFASKAPFTLHAVLEVLHQMGAALDAIHAKEIVHRDVKPANLFLIKPQPGRRLSCKLLDFGVAKVGLETTRLTRAGAILGTPCYMAPEQANRAMHVDGRADLFSLGVVAFELITGRLPWKSKSDLARLANILTESARPVRSLAPNLPEEVARLVDQLLFSSLEDRVQTASEVRDLAGALLEILPKEELQAVHAKVRDVDKITKSPTWDVASEQTRELASMDPDERPPRFNSELTREINVEGAIAFEASGELPPELEASFSVGSEPTNQLDALSPMDPLLLKPSTSGPTQMEDGLPVLGGLPDDMSSPWHRTTGPRMPEEPPVEPGTEYSPRPDRGPIGLGDGPTEFYNPHQALDASTSFPQLNEIPLDDDPVPPQSEVSKGDERRPPSDQLEASSTVFDTDAPPADPADASKTDGELEMPDVSDEELASSATVLNLEPPPKLEVLLRPQVEHDFVQFDGLDLSMLPPKDASLIVGRKVAMDRLMLRIDKAFDFERPALTAVVGSAGRGKTSIRLNLHQAVTDRFDKSRVFAGRAEEVCSVTPYSYLKRIMCSLAGVQPGLPSEEVQHKIGELLPLSDFAVPSGESEVLGVLGGSRTRVTGQEEVEYRRETALSFIAHALGLPGPESLALKAAQRAPRLLAIELDSALENALFSVARRAGLIVLIDDAHEIDEASARVLARLLRRVGLKLALVAFTLPSGLDKNRRHPLFKPGKVDVERINLLPLDRQPARELALRLARGTIEPEALSTIVELSKGHPLMLAHVVPAALENKMLVADGKGGFRLAVDASRLPGTVSSALRRRIEVMPVSLLKILEIAAVVGESFWFGVLSEVTDLSDDALRESIDKLVEQDWVRIRKVSRVAGDQEFEFGHAVMRTVILSTFSKSQRTKLTQRAVKVMLRYSDLEATLIAAQLGKAGRHEESAIKYREAAGRALALGQATTSARLCEEGLRFAKGTEEEVRLWDLKAQSALQLGEWESGRDAFDELSDLVKEPTGRAELFVRRAELAAASHRFEEARVEASEGGTAFRELDDPQGAARAELWIAEASESIGDLRRALRAYLRVHGTLNEDHAQHPRSIRGMARVLEASGDYENARARWKQSLARCRAAHDADGALQSEIGLADVTRLLGDFNRATSIVMDARESAYLMQDRLMFEVILASLEAEREDFESARQRLWRVIKKARGPIGDDVRRIAVLRMAQWQRNQPTEPWDPDLVEVLEEAARESITAKPGLRPALELLLAQAKVRSEPEKSVATARDIADKFGARGAMLAEEPPGLYLSVSVIERRAGNTLESLENLRRGLGSAKAIAKRLERDQREAYKQRWLVRALGHFDNGEGTDTLSPKRR